MLSVFSPHLISFPPRPAIQLPLLSLELILPFLKIEKKKGQVLSPYSNFQPLAGTSLVFLFIMIYPSKLSAVLPHHAKL